MASRLTKRLGPVATAATALVQSALAAREHWQLLEQRERERLQTLIRKSKGRPSNLTAAERRELSELVQKLDPAQLGRRVVDAVSPLPARLRGKRRR